MEKEICCQLKKKLEPVSPGKGLLLNHTLYSQSTEEKCFSLPDSENIRVFLEHYDLYPGISITFACCMGDKLSFHHTHGPSVLKIDHCNQGRIGWNMENGQSLYMGKGDLAVHARAACKEAKTEITFPLGYYQGITVSMDLNILEQKLPAPLNESELKKELLSHKFGASQEIFSFPANKRVEHIFSELYDLPQEMKFPYLKLKCQELLLFLYMEDPFLGKSGDPYYSDQVEVIKSIHSLLTENLTERFTIEELSKKYRMNSSSLKNIFKSVYGLPIASYMKEYRIRQGAAMLRDSQESIASIARSVGYESQSKFTKAFKTVMDMLPTDYRKQYQREGQEQNRQGLDSKSL